MRTILYFLLFAILLGSLFCGDDKDGCDGGYQKEKPPFERPEKEKK